MNHESLTNEHQRKLFIYAQEFFSEWSKKELLEKVLADLTIEQAQNLYEARIEE